MSLLEFLEEYYEQRSQQKHEVCVLKAAVFVLALFQFIYLSENLYFL